MYPQRQTGYFLLVFMVSTESGEPDFSSHCGCIYWLYRHRQMILLAEMANANPYNAGEVVEPPTSPITSLSFAQNDNYLVATSIDQVKVWAILEENTSEKKTSISSSTPVLCSTWKDERTVLYGGCDNKLIEWDFMNGRNSTLFAHGGPIKEVAWIPEKQVVVTGGWDKTMRYMDLRQNGVIYRNMLPDCCHALTVRHSLIVVGTADRNLIIYDIRDLKNELRRIISPLKHQTRCLAAFHDGKGFLVGSTEGRVGVCHLDDAQAAQQMNDFIIKCHSEHDMRYSVNSLNFHPMRHNTFAAAASDGAVSFWDKENALRLKVMPRCNQPILCSSFNKDGSIFAYAACADWRRQNENERSIISSPKIFLYTPE